MLISTKKMPPLPLLSAIAALTPLGVDLYLPAFPGIAEDLATEASLVQNSLSLFLVGFALGLLFFGPCSDRFGRRPLALLGVFGFILSSLFISLSSSIEGFLSLRFLQGFLGSAATVVIPAIIRDCYGKNMAKGMSSVSIIMLLAPLLAPIIGSYLLVIGNWPILFHFLTGYAIILFIFTFLFLPETLNRENGFTSKLSFIKNYKIILANRKVYPDLLCFMLTSLIFFTYLTSAPFIYITYFKVPETIFGVAFATTAGALILSNFINIRIVSRFGSRKIMQWGLSGSVVFTAFLVIINLAQLNVYWTLGCFILLIGSIGLSSANANALILIEFPNQASSASAVTGTLRFGIGALAGPILIAIHNGTPLPLSILLFILASIALIAQALNRQKT